MIFANTYVPFPQPFAKGKSLKSEGIGMPRDRNKGLHGNYLIGPQLGHAEPIPDVHVTVKQWTNIVSRAATFHRYNAPEEKLPQIVAE
jgi:hypothetical protein